MLSRFPKGWLIWPLVLVGFLASLSTTWASAPHLLQPAVIAQNASNDPDLVVQRAVELTNLERASAGLPPLKTNPALMAAARAHSLAMSEGDFFDHTNPTTGSTPGDRARAAGYLWTAIGENIGLGYPSPEDAVMGWMASQGHRENLLNPDFREIGVGFVKGPGPQANCQHPPCEYYWTQVFGARDDYFPVVINEEAASAATAEVALYIYGQGWAQEMRLRNDEDNFTPWEPFAPRRTWLLPNTPGPHRVTVELRNAAGEVRAAEDEIYLGAPQTTSEQAGSGGQVVSGATTSPAPGGPGGGGAAPLQVERNIRSKNLLVGEETDVAFILTGDPTPCGEQVVRSPLDIALVIDHSGSMSDSAGPGTELTKLEAAKQAAIAFLRAVELGTDQVAVISFDDSARLEQGLDIQLEKISAAISALQPGGGTNIADGLLAGFNELKGSRGRKDAARVIILLSDGQSPARDAAQQIKAEGARIITIGLGPDVDEDELRATASSPTDYYFSPDATQLEAIFQTIARTIRELPAATDIIVTHRFDVTNFEVVPDSIQPQGQLLFDRIIWRIPKLGKEVQQLAYRVRARVQGDFDLSLDDKIEFLRCGKSQEVISLGSGLSVQVTLDPNATPTPIPTPVPEPVTMTQAVFNLICGDFPWWLLLSLFLFLILLALIRFANLGGWRERWTAHRQCPRCCVLANLLFLGYAFFLLALLLRALQPAFCQPKAALYYWEVTPDGQSRILYKPLQPDLPVREFKALNKQADCVACHNVALNADVIAAIADGSNGPVITMRLDGTPINTPPIRASYVALSPDGRQLAYAAEGKDIYILDLESGASMPLLGASDPGVIETMPAWSPDGSTIAFVRAHGEVRGYALAVPSDIYTVPATGGVATLLPGAGNGGFNYYPAYSPDGRWLAFTRHTTGSSTRADPQAEIYIVPTQGGEARRLAANDLSSGQPLTGVSNSWPTWSPDGRFLAFNTKRNGGQFDIYIAPIDPDGNSGAARPLSGAARPDRFEHLPQWGRPPRVNLLARLLGWLPWLLGLPLLWLLQGWACRARQYSHTVTLTGEVDPISGNVNEQVFRVRLTLTGNNSDCEPIRTHKPADVLLVLDVSSSMNEGARVGLGERKIDGAKNAAKAFVQKLDPQQDRVGLIVFNDSAQVLHSLDADINAISAAIEGLQSSGGTAIHEGLRVALEEMKDLRRAGVAGTVILLSDGESDPTAALEQAAAIREEGLRLITIGFGKDANQDLLQQLATTPKDWHASASNRQLEQVFVSIAEDLQAPPAATDIVFIHQVNTAEFELDEGSIYPRPASVRDGTITWRFNDLEVPRTLRYSVVGKKVGDDLPINVRDIVRYKRCGDIPMEGPPQPLQLRVSVSEPPPPLDGVKIDRPPEPLSIPERKPVWEPDAALIIGTGTFGRQVLTHLKKNLRDAGLGTIPERVQFILLDTRQYLASGKPFQFAGVHLDEADVIVLDENLAPVITQMNSDKASHQELRPWFPAESYAGGAAQTHTLAEGTHGQRPIARAGLVRRVSGKAVSSAGDRSVDLIERLRQALSAVNQPSVGVRAILIGSLSEGMGGTLWDLAYLVREIGRQHLGEITPVAIEGYFDLQTHSGISEPAHDAELNALIALRELTWFQFNPGLPIPFDYGDEQINQRFKPLTKRLVDDIYLSISDAGTGPSPSSIASLADLITLRLDLETRRRLDAAWYETRRKEAEDVQIRMREICFGTGGSFAVRLPAYDLIEMVKARWAREMIQSFLMGDLREDLAFSSQYVTDPGLPTDPAALAPGFFHGLEQEFDLGDVTAPSSVRSLGLVWSGKTAEAAKLPADSDTQAIQRYVSATLRLLLMGTERAPEQQRRAGKIGYASEFLEALKHICEGELKQRINQAVVADSVRQSWLKTRQALLDEIEQGIEHLSWLKRYLGDVYGALTQHQQSLVEWRQEMDALTSRCYVWEEIIDPTGKRLDHPRNLADIWYDKAYQQAKPQDFARYLFWEGTKEDRIDLRLLLARDETVGSAAMSPEAFANQLLRFADNRLRKLWQQASLDAVAEQAIVRLVDRFLRGRDKISEDKLLTQLSEEIKELVRTAGGGHFQQGPKVDRYALASSAQRGKLHDLLSAFPAQSGQDWPRLPLSDPLSWQLVYTQDGLVPSRLKRYGKLVEVASADQGPRAVFAWEAIAKKERGRYGNQLLHPVVAAALINEDRAHLYGLAFASSWVVDGKIQPQGHDNPIMSWSTPKGWDENVYGLLHFVFRAEDSQVRALDRAIAENAAQLDAQWLEYAKMEPIFLRRKGDGEDLYSLRLLAQYAAKRKVAEMRRSQTKS